MLYFTRKRGKSLFWKEFKAFTNLPSSNTRRGEKIPALMRPPVPQNIRKQNCHQQLTINYRVQIRLSQ